MRKHHEQQLKEVRLRPKTDENDRRIKINRAIEFFRRGDKVQFTMVFRGRERFHREVALDVLQKILAQLSEKVRVERPPSMEGRHMVMILSPLKNAFTDEASAAEKAPTRTAEPPPPPRAEAMENTSSA